MVSKRRYFIIFLMMLVLLFIFQFSQVAKEELSVDKNDKYLNTTLPDESTQWSGTSQTSGETGRKVLFIGDEKGEVGKNAAAWCKYIKAEFECMDSLPDISSDDSLLMVLIDAESIDTDSYMNTVTEYTERGDTVVFATLPDYDIIVNNKQLRDILGITKVTQDSVTVDGIRVFEGVFLGGEAIYQASGEDNEEYQDLNLTMPWYVTAEGSKSYIVGLLDEEQYEREQFPRIIWRYTGNYTMVFAVNGDYLSTDAAFGILDLFLYESSDVALYPVVNAQSTVFTDTFVLTDECSKNVLNNYNRGISTAMEDIFIPGLISLAKNEKIVPTFMLMTKYDLEADSSTNLSELSTYLRQINEMSGEAGYSYRYVNGTLKDKAEYDDSILGGAGTGYCFRTAYLDDLSELDDIGSDVVSVVTDDGNVKFFEYCKDDVTAQKVTAMATDYSYSKDFLLRSMNSSLGYMNITADFHDTFWSDEEQYRWENYFDDVNSNFSTYWSKFALYEQTTVSDSDARIRRFLALDYSYDYDDDVITLTVTDGGNDCYFLLRTHNKEIDDVKNAEYTLIDDNAILLHVTGESVTVTLKDSGEVLKYDDSVF